MDNCIPSPSNTFRSFYSNNLTNAVQQVGVDPGAAGSFPRGVMIAGYRFENNSASVMYVQLFNANSSAAPTLGTTTPDRTIQVKAGDSAVIYPAVGLYFFEKGCYVAATTTRTGSTAPATAGTCDIWYAQE